MGVRDDAAAYNTNLTEFLEFNNMLIVAEAVVEGALRRRESRGAHYRSDYPRQDGTFSVHTRCIWSKEGLCLTNA